MASAFLGGLEWPPFDWLCHSHRFRPGFCSHMLHYRSAVTAIYPENAQKYCPDYLTHPPAAPPGPSAHRGRLSLLPLAGPTEG
jgi:hypothetical protein